MVTPDLYSTANRFFKPHSHFHSRLGNLNGNPDILLAASPDQINGILARLRHVQIVRNVQTLAMATLKVASVNQIPKSANYLLLGTNRGMIGE